MTEAILVFDPFGGIACLWNELVPLRELGAVQVARASSVEFNPASSEWEVRWTGQETVVFSNQSRDACIAWEVEQLNAELSTR